MSLRSNRDSTESLVDHGKGCETNNSMLDESLKASEGKLSDAQHLMPHLELTKNTVDYLATEVDEG